MMRDQHDAIKETLTALEDAVHSYSATFEKSASSEDLSAVSQISQAHVEMVKRVKQMQSAVYGPLNMVMLHFEEVRRLFQGSLWSHVYSVSVQAH